MKEKVLEIINKSDWAIIKDQDNIKMIQVQSGKKKINIYWGTMTVVYTENAQFPVYDVGFNHLRDILGVKKSSDFKLIKVLFDPRELPIATVIALTLCAFIFGLFGGFFI